MKTATFQRFTWRGYTVEADGWADGHDVEWESLSIKNDEGEELDQLTLLTEFDGVSVLQEIADKFIEGCVEDRQERIDGTYWSSCD